MNSPICDYSQRTSKPSSYAFIQNFCQDCCSISFQCSCFYPLGSIIYGYKNVFFPNISSYWLNWSHKIKSPFHKWLFWKNCDQFGKTLNCQSSCSLACIIRSIRIMHIFVHSWPPMFDIQYPTKNLPFCNYLIQLVFSCMRHLQLQIRPVA